MSNKGWPSLKGCKLMSKSHLRPAQESSQICYKNNHKDFSGSCTCPQAHTGYKLTTGASSSNLRQLGAYYWFINILYLHTSDYNRLNYGKDVQQNLLLRNLQLSTILEPLSICIPFPDWWLVQALFCTGQNQEEETKNIKREAKRDCYNSFEVSPQSLDCCWSVVKSCLTLYDPMNCSTPGFPVLHYLPEFAQTHVH